MPKIVPASGSLSAKIAIIGEAPGEQEEKLGQPFIGRAGERLDTFLAEHKILRDELYITNVVKERPPSNDISIFIKPPNAKGEVRTTDAYDMYERQLHQELEHCRANVFVPVGNVALYALTRRWYILRERGSILRADEETIGDKKVIPTIHPAATFHAPLFAYSIKRDFQLIKRESSSPTIPPPTFKLTLDPSYTESMNYLASLQSGSIVAYDIEVSGAYELSCISFARPDNTAISIPFHTLDRRELLIPMQETNIMLEIARVLEDPSILKVAHNSIFDNTFMFHRYGIRVQTCDDTMIMHGILYPELPKTLAYLTSMYTEVPFYKDDGDEGKTGYGDDLTFWEYNAKDSAVLTLIAPELIRRLDRQGNLATYHHQLKCVEPLSFMEMKGIHVNREGIVAGSSEEAKQISVLEHKLEKLMQERLKDPTFKLPKTFAGSHKQKCAYFYGACKQQPYTKMDKKTKKSKPYCDNKALTRLARKGIKEAELMVEISHRKKLVSSYLGVRFDPDGRLRGSWNPVMKSGRFSCQQIWRG